MRTPAVVLLVIVLAIVAGGCRNRAPIVNNGNKPAATGTSPQPTKFEEPAISTTQVGEPKADGTYISGLAYSPSGKVLASSGLDGKVILWDTTAKCLVNKLDWRGMGKMTGIAISEDYVASSTQLLDVRLWRVDGSMVTQLQIKAAIHQISFSPLGMLAVASDAGVHVWEDPVKGGPRLFPGAAMCLAWSVDGNRLVTGLTDGSVVLYSTDGWRTERRLQGDARYMKSVALSPDGVTIAAGGIQPGVGPCVRVWTLDPPAQREFTSPRMGYLEQVTFTPDGKYLASTHTKDYVLRFWDVSTGGVAASLTHNYLYGPVAIHPAGTQVVTGGVRDIMFWRIDCPPSDPTRVVAHARPVEAKPDANIEVRSPEDALRRARGQMEAGNGADAMSALDTALAKWPRNVDLLRYRLYVCERRLSLREAYDTQCAISAAEGDPMSDREKAALCDRYADMYLEEARRAHDSLYTKKADVLNLLDDALSLKPGAEVSRKIREYRDQVSREKDK